jgi:hypothetical protein
MFEKLKNLFKKQEDTPIARKELPKPTPKQVKAKTELTEKEKATAAGEPYIAITKVEINPENINDGAFDLDFNDKFVLNLIKAGYRQREDDTDVIIVDRWFQTVCRNVALEMYEQQVADPENRTESRDARVIRTKDLGNGRTEVS